MYDEAIILYNGPYTLCAPRLWPFESDPQMCSVPLEYQAISKPRPLITTTTNLSSYWLRTALPVLAQEQQTRSLSWK